MPAAFLTTRGEDAFAERALSTLLTIKIQFDAIVNQTKVLVPWLPLSLHRHTSPGQPMGQRLIGRRGRARRVLALGGRRVDDRLHFCN
jgi:hypothetical protein